MAIPYLNIPNYPDPTNNNSLITACGIISSLQADFQNGQGSIGLVIYRSFAAYQASSEPLERVQIRAGSPARTRAIKGIPTGASYPNLVAIQTAMEAQWGALWVYFLTQLTNQNVFVGSTVLSG